MCLVNQAQDETIGSLVARQPVTADVLDCLWILDVCSGFFKFLDFLFISFGVSPLYSSSISYLPTCVLSHLFLVSTSVQFCFPEFLSDFNIPGLHPFAFFHN